MTISTNVNRELTHFNDREVQLIKDMLCKEINDYELKFFSDVCKRTGLDPFTKQIYAIKRKGQMTIQTSIDGYRLIAERTGKYCPGKEPTFVYNEHHRLISATAYVKKQTADGSWHEVAATAFFDEYKPSYPSQFWDSKPHIMLSKCAEALALRKAFPSDLSQLYTKEEMDQADNHTSIKHEIISEVQFKELESLLEKCSIEFQNKINLRLIEMNINSLQLLPLNKFDVLKNFILKEIDTAEKNLEIQEVTNG